MNSCSWFSKFSLFLKLLIRIFFVLLNKVYSIFSFYFFNFWIKTSQVSNNTTCIFQRADCWTLFFFLFCRPAARGVPRPGIPFWGTVAIYAGSVATTDPFTHCAWLGIEPVSQHSRNTTDPVVPQRKLLLDIFALCFFPTLMYFFLRSKFDSLLTSLCLAVAFLKFFFFFLLFRIIPVAYGSSQARGWIGATAACLHHSHSNARSEPCLQPAPQFTETPDP